MNQCRVDDILIMLEKIPEKIVIREKCILYDCVFFIVLSK